MISQIKKLIQEHPEWLHSPGEIISFMKASTPASGTKGVDGGKVLLFVFEGGEVFPTLCVKTTRVYSDRDVIRRNYSNLKALHEEVSGNEYALMFAKPLHLYDDGEFSFCIETVCPGATFSAEASNVELVIEKYIAWQSYLAQNTQKFQTLGNGLKLPVLTQHGDMTPDNVLVSGKNVYLIDYDYAGVSQLPGFDLFSFISKARLSPEIERSYYDKYFPLYFKSIGALVESYEDLFPFYHAEELSRKGEKI